MLAPVAQTAIVQISLKVVCMLAAIATSDVLYLLYPFILFIVYEDVLPIRSPKWHFNSDGVLAAAAFKFTDAIFVYQLTFIRREFVNVIPIIIDHLLRDVAGSSVGHVFPAGERVGSRLRLDAAKHVKHTGQ